MALKFKTSFGEVKEWVDEEEMISVLEYFEFITASQAEEAREWVTNGKGESVQNNIHS